MQPLSLQKRLPNITTSIILENINLTNLWKECNLQNRKAQAQFYSYFSKKMFAVCMRYSHTTLEAEDILQNGFVKIFTKHNTYDGKGSLEGWMKRIMINTAIEVYRANQRKLTESIDDNENIQIESHLVADQMGYKDLLKLVQHLPLGYRTVFNLYAIEGYTHKEIAEMLCITEGSSKSQLSRARQWLQTKISKQAY